MSTVTVTNPVDSISGMRVRVAQSGGAPIFNQVLPPGSSCDVDVPTDYHYIDVTRVPDYAMTAHVKNNGTSNVLVSNDGGATFNPLAGGAEGDYALAPDPKGMSVKHS